MVNDHGIIIHKAGYKKGKRHDYNIMRHGHNSNLFSTKSYNLKITLEIRF
jgi:hypothetical protein